jgi:hypothetical protein
MIHTSIITFKQGSKIIVREQNRWLDLINSIENSLFELTKNDISTFELIDILVFLFQYKRCRTIHEIIKLKGCNKEMFQNINWYLKNETSQNIKLPF